MESIRLDVPFCRHTTILQSLNVETAKFVRSGASEQ